MILNWVNTNGESLLFGVVQDILEERVQERGIEDPDQVREFLQNGTAAFYGNFYLWVNVTALVLQGLVVSRILKYGGFAPLLLMLPVISLLSYSLMALFPVLAVIKVMKVAENSTNYSINNTARQVLWLPTTREMKYRAKTGVDTVFVRFGDMLAAMTIGVGFNLLAVPLEGLFFFNVVLVGVWLVLALVIIRENRRFVRRERRQAAAESMDPVAAPSSGVGIR